MWKIYAPVVAKELGLNNNSSTDTFNGINNLSANDIIDNDIKDLNIKFDIDNIPIENGGLPDIYWRPKMHKNPVKARFIIASRKSSIKLLDKAITLIFRLFFRQIQVYGDKCRFLGSTEHQDSNGCNK